MDTMIENIFLDNFIDKRIRDRMKYELSWQAFENPVSPLNGNITLNPV
jgi:hypothetical protein